MKKFLLSRILLVGAFLLLGYSAVRAGQARMVITTNSGTTAEFLIADSPEITFQDNILVVKAGSNEISTEAANVKSFEFFPGDASGVDQITVYGGTLSGLLPGSPVEIYTFDGQLVATFKADNSQSVNLDLGSLAPGFYIVRTPSASFKIKK